ncbi:hypothetical protein CF326_g2090 [Tilletia indica]|uniref:Uncharacterized protein n=1 Tax=Tilletia indica TaxID=43049 RepID=A0A177TY36_9BASI|nr:hypothetical protein CF326_g2090 [Tilletia indica]KAE8244634.1 hypothetical protein A4X13_0g6421 [Tilletia indica]
MIDASATTSTATPVPTQSSGMAMMSGLNDQAWLFATRARLKNKPLRRRQAVPRTLSGSKRRSPRYYPPALVDRGFGELFGTSGRDSRTLSVFLASVSQHSKHLRYNHALSRSHLTSGDGSCAISGLKDSSPNTQHRGR